MKAVSMTDADADSDASDGDASERPPPLVVTAIQRVKDKPDSIHQLRLSNLGIRDVHLQYIIDACHSSKMHLESLDLSFNKITDAGIHVLCRCGGACTRGCGASFIVTP